VYNQWSTGGGGLAPCKTGWPLKTPGSRPYMGASKRPHEITRQIQYMIATYQYHCKHRWWCTVPGYMIDKPCSIFLLGEINNVA